MIQNCGGTNRGGGASDIIVADRLINEAWDNVGTGRYLTAQESFRQALKEPMTENQRISAHSGMGWALAKDGKILEAIPYFEIAAEQDKEAMVGLAGALIYRHQSSFDFVRAAEMLGNMPPEQFTPQRPGLALSPAKVHALAGLSYALAGDMPQARFYMNKAAALDSMMVGTTVDKIDEAFTLLGWKNDN